MRSSHFSCVFGQLFQPRGELPLEELSLHRIKNTYMYFALLAIALEVLIKTCGGATLTVSPAHTAEPLRSVSPHFISFALGENIIPPEVYIKLPATVLILNPRLPCCAGAAFSPVLASPYAKRLSGSGSANNLPLHSFSKNPNIIVIKYMYCWAVDNAFVRDPTKLPPDQTNSTRIDFQNPLLKTIMPLVSNGYIRIGGTNGLRRAAHHY